MEAQNWIKASEKSDKQISNILLDDDINVEKLLNSPYNRSV